MDLKSQSTIPNISMTCGSNLNWNPRPIQNQFHYFFNRNTNLDKESYINFPLSCFPDLLHKIFRYTISVLGVNSSALILITVMKNRAKVFFQVILFDLISSFLQDNYGFFYKFGGKLLSPISKPRLTEEHKKQCILWGGGKWKSRLELDNNRVALPSEFVLFGRICAPKCALWNLCS